MKKISELTGYDKAAIIVELLGDSLAINVFKDISEADFFELRQHAKKISNEISITTKKDILDYYYLKMLSAQESEDISLNKNMFDFLDKLDDEQLYKLLSIEKAHVIALALDQIDNDKRMLLISKLDQQKQTDIILQTGNLNLLFTKAIYENYAIKLQIYF